MRAGARVAPVARSADQLRTVGRRSAGSETVVPGRRLGTQTGRRSRRVGGWLDAFGAARRPRQQRQQFAALRKDSDPSKRCTATLTPRSENVIALDAVGAEDGAQLRAASRCSTTTTAVIFHRIITASCARAATRTGTDGAAKATASTTSCPSAASTRSARWPWPTPARHQRQPVLPRSPTPSGVGLRRIQPVRPDREGPRRARADAARRAPAAATVRATTSSSTPSRSASD